MTRAMSKTKKAVLALIAIGVVALLLCGTYVAIDLQRGNGETRATIIYSSEKKKPTVTLGDESIDRIESGQGEAGDEVEVEKADGQEIPTVESVDSGGPVTETQNTECPEGEECGRGSATPTVDVSSPSAFLNATLGKCYDVDGYYNEQCWDYAALFFINYAGHTFYTCGTGAAKGAIADGCWQKNATDKFTMVWDSKQVQAGDWVVFNNGQYGHVGMATGAYNNGYVTLAGQNQGGGLCPGSTMGAKVNLINISLKHFAGAFRPNIYIKPDPAPEPTPTPEGEPYAEYLVKRGDTLGGILRRLGYTGDNLFGNDGLAQKVATLNGVRDRGLIYPGQKIKIANADLK